jgi:hypothetical protein
MKIKKILLSFVLIQTIFYSLDALFFDIHFDYDVFPVYSESEVETYSKPNLEVENFKIEYGNGLIQSVYKVQKVLTALKDPELPLEGSLETVQERLEKILIGKKISLAIYLFIILLALAQSMTFSPSFI